MAFAVFSRMRPRRGAAPLRWTTSYFHSSPPGASAERASQTIRRDGTAGLHSGGAQLAEGGLADGLLDLDAQHLRPVVVLRLEVGQEPAADVAGEKFSGG